MLFVDRVPIKKSFNQTLIFFYLVDRLYQYVYSKVFWPSRLRPKILGELLAIDRLCYRSSPNVVFTVDNVNHTILRIKHLFQNGRLLLTCIVFTVSYITRNMEMATEMEMERGLEMEIVREM
jgi:hypothetical protein